MILWPFLITITMACNKQEMPDPVASFFIPRQEYEAGEAIEAENLSLNATDYVWECGTKTYSTKTPEKFMFVILEPGNYTLRLTAGNGIKKSVKEQQITITPKPVTIMQIKTLHENGSVFTGCMINIYISQDDFLNSQNVAYTSKTNDNGIFEIKNIKAGTYWFDAFYAIDENNMYLNWYEGGIYSIEVKEKETNMVNTVLKLFAVK